MKSESNFGEGTKILTRTDGEFDNVKISHKSSDVGSNSRAIVRKLSSQKIFSMRPGMFEKQEQEQDIMSLYTFIK